MIKEYRYQGRTCNLDQFWQTSNAGPDETTDNLVAVSTIPALHILDRLSIGKIGNTREKEEWAAFANMHKADIFRARQPYFHRLVRKLDADAIAFPQRFVKGVSRAEMVDEVGAEVAGR